MAPALPRRRAPWAAGSAVWAASHPPPDASGSSNIILIGGRFMVDGVPVPCGDLAAQNGTLTGTVHCESGGGGGRRGVSAWCRGGAVCRIRCRDMPLCTSICRSLERKCWRFIGSFVSCQRGGRRFKPGLVLQESRAPSRSCAEGLSFVTRDLEHWRTSSSLRFVPSLGQFAWSSAPRHGSRGIEPAPVTAENSTLNI